VHDIDFGILDALVPFLSTQSAIIFAEYL